MENKNLSQVASVGLLIGIIAVFVFPVRWSLTHIIVIWRCTHLLSSKYYEGEIKLQVIYSRRVFLDCAIWSCDACSLQLDINTSEKQSAATFRVRSIKSKQNVTPKLCVHLWDYHLSHPEQNSERKSCDVTRQPLLKVTTTDSFQNSEQNFEFVHSLHEFYVYGSMHCESLSIIVRQDATVYGLLYFCKLLYMFQAVNPSIIRRTYNCNYSI
jgi:hypothetical protein